MPLVKRGRVGIIGQRSWIAKELIQGLITDTSDLIISYDKERIREGRPDESERDMSHLDCLYLIAGRAQPTDVEMILETMLLSALAATDMALQPKKIVYISSLAVHEETAYGKHKLMCENILKKSKQINDLIIVRPGAIFGSSQDHNSPMLVPTLARTGGEIKLSTPDKPTEFVWIKDLVRFLIDLRTLQHQRLITTRVIGSFEMTPRQMQALYNTWRFSEAKQGTDV